MQEDEYRGVLASADKLEKALSNTVAELRKRLESLGEMVESQEKASASLAKRFASAVKTIEDSQQNSLHQGEDAVALVKKTAAIQNEQFVTFLRQAEVGLQEVVSQSTASLHREIKQGLSSQCQTLNDQAKRQEEEYAALTRKVADMIGECNAFVGAQDKMFKALQRHTSTSIDEYQKVADSIVKRISHTHWLSVVILFILSISLGAVAAWAILKGGG